MTFQTFEEFTEFVYETEGITLQETNFPEDNHQWLTIENIEESNPLILTEILLSAYDSGFHLGSFYADRYNGEITITE